MIRPAMRSTTTWRARTTRSITAPSSEFGRAGPLRSDTAGAHRAARKPHGAGSNRGATASRPESPHDLGQTEITHFGPVVGLVPAAPAVAPHVEVEGFRLG